MWAACSSRRGRLANRFCLDEVERMIRSSQEGSEFEIVHAVRGSMRSVAFTFRRHSTDLLTEPHRSGLTLP